MPLIPPEYISQLDQAIRQEVHAAGSLTESVKAYAGQSEFHAMNLKRRVEARLPENVAIWTINRITQLLRSNPHHPRVRYG